MISIVCVYNNEKIINEYLLKSLKNQTVNFELIALDNTKGKYQSAAEALNYGGTKAKGDYIMFVHQDVDLSSNSWLKEVEKVLETLPNLGIAGVAGMSEYKSGAITNIKHGTPSKLVGKIQITCPTKVQTLDECLVIVPRAVFNMLQFDEKVCNDWHLYAVDYSLCTKRLGFDVCVIPMFVYYLSPGYSMTKKYFLTLEKVMEKHRKNHKRICTTMGDWSTFYPLCIQRQRIWRFAKAGLEFLLANDKQEAKQKGMKRLIFFTGGDFYNDPATRYRGYYLAGELEKKGFLTKVIPPSYIYYYSLRRSVIKIVLDALIDVIKKSIETLKVKNYDIIYIQRSMHPGPPLLPLVCKKIYKKRMIFDFDDALFLENPPKIRTLVKISDVVIVGSHYLEGYAKKYNKNVFLIPTSIDTNKYSSNEEKTENTNVIIGWIGGCPSIKYLELLVEPFEILGKKYDIEFRIIGAENCEQNIPHFRNINVKVIPWKFETEWKEISYFDIGIMPLFDTSWEKGKCGFKALQYMTMSVPPVCSAVGENTYIINDGTNGFLASNTMDWVDKLEALIRDRNLREKIGRQGRKTIEERYSLKINGEKIASIIREYLIYN